MGTKIKKVLGFLGAICLAVVVSTSAGASNLGTFTGSVSLPTGSSFNASVPLSAASGLSLNLNAASGGHDIKGNFNNGATGGLTMYDGGSANWSNVNGGSGLSFSSSATTYNRFGFNISGTGVLSGLLSANGGINATASTVGGVSMSGGTLTAPGNVASNGLIYTSLNAQGNGFNPGSGGAALSWNASGGGGEADLSTGYAFGNTAGFWFFNGTTMQQSSSIAHDGTYAAGNAFFGPGFAYEPGGNTQTGSYELGNNVAGCPTVLGAGGGSVAGVPADAFYVYTPCAGVQSLAVSNAGDVGVSRNLGVAGIGIFGASIVSAGATVPPVYNASGAQLCASTHIATGIIQNSSSVTTVGLSGAATFPGNNYNVLVSEGNYGGNPVSAFVSGQTPNSFVITVTFTQGQTEWLAIGC